jgi:hypothetical protein
MTKSPAQPSASERANQTILSGSRTLDGISADLTTIPAVDPHTNRCSDSADESENHPRIAPSARTSRRGFIMNSFVSAAAIASATAIPNIGFPASADPVFAVIERHKALSAAYDVAVNHPDVGDNSPEFAELNEISNLAGGKMIEHADVLFAFRPTSSAGVGALLRYISTLEDWQMPRDLAEPSEIECLKRLCRSLSIALTTSSGAAAIEQISEPLIEIGAKFDEAAAQQIEADTRSNELFEPIHEAIEAQATWPDDQEKWTSDDARNYHATRGRVIDDIGAEWASVTAELEDVHHWRTDKLMRAIWATPAHSMAGLGIKAKAAALASNHFWDKPFGELDWDHKGPRALIEAVLDVAGLPPAPQFLGIEEA